MAPIQAIVVATHRHSSMSRRALSIATPMLHPFANCSPDKRLTVIRRTHRRNQAFCPRDQLHGEKLKTANRCDRLAIENPPDRILTGGTAGQVVDQYFTKEMGHGGAIEIDVRIDDDAAGGPG